MYFTLQELINKYNEIVEGRKRRIEIEEKRFECEIEELRRKTKISQLDDDRELLPWEED